MRGYWIIAAVFTAMYLTACKGSASAVPNLSDNGDGINLPLIRLDLDLTRVVLGPEDVSDLFQGVTYSINQTIVSPESQGVIVTYPTQFLAHTTAFAYGFSTRIEIFTNIDQAVKSYDTILTQQLGEVLAMKLVGDDSRAFVRTVLTPEGFDLNSSEYAVLFRERNAVATIILRTDMKVSPTRLSQLTELVIDRLQP
ncbi:MAG: hypothetical protein KKA65_05825 [Nanoarchaeota archaeon]|nr:hypothetical protein [Nanoarchaeota archaeon]